MTVTIQLSQEQAAALEAQASAEGLPVDVWLQRLAEQHAHKPEPPANEPAAAAERPIWATITERMKKLPAEVFKRPPRDGASEHDHCLYGSPKRNR